MDASTPSRMPPFPEFLEQVERAAKTAYYIEILSAASAMACYGLGMAGVHLLEELDDEVTSLMMASSAAPQVAAENMLQSNLRDLVQRGEDSPFDAASLDTAIGALFLPLSGDKAAEFNTRVMLDSGELSEDLEASLAMERGKLYLLLPGREGDAMAQAKRLSEMTQSPSAQYNAAVLYARLDDVPAGVASLERLLEFPDDDVDFLYAAVLNALESPALTSLVTRQMLSFGVETPEPPLLPLSPEQTQEIVQYARKRSEVTSTNLLVERLASYIALFIATREKPSLPETEHVEAAARHLFGMQNTPHAAAMLGYVLNERGNHDEAVDVMRPFVQFQHGLGRLEFSLALTGIGDRAGAFAQLQVVLTEHPHMLPDVIDKDSHHYAPLETLRTEPGYTQFMDNIRRRNP